MSAAADSGNGSLSLVPPAPPLRVLQVIGNAIVGGMETWVLRLVERLPRERFAFTALCPFESRFTEKLRALGLEVLIAPMPDDPPWSTIQMAASIVKAGRIDLLHAHLPKAHLLAGIVGRLTGRPVLTTVHGRQVGTLDLEVHRSVGSHLSVVCQPAYYQALSLGVRPSRLSCEPNGVDATRFAPRSDAAARQAWRAGLGLPQPLLQAPLVGFAGRLSVEKAPDVAVRAALALRQRCPEAQMVMVGDGPMRAALQSLAQDLGVADMLHFAGVRENMPEVYNALDVLVNSSHTEAMPLTLMEAMASGLPVVATRVGGVPDIVAEGETGFLVAPGDAADIAARTALLLADPALRTHMAVQARQRALEKFPLDAAVHKVGALMERLVRRAAAPPRQQARHLPLQASAPLTRT